MYYNESIFENRPEYYGPETSVLFAAKGKCGGIKFGCTNILHLSSNLCRVQHSSVGDENCLGDIYCHSPYESRRIKKHIKRLFNSTDDCLPDTPELRDFIKKHFKNANDDVRFSRDIKREYDNDRRFYN